MARCSQPGISGGGCTFVFDTGFTPSSQICIDHKAALFAASCLLSCSRLCPAGCQTEEAARLHLCEEARGAIPGTLQPLSTAMQSARRGDKAAHAAAVSPALCGLVQRFSCCGDVVGTITLSNHKKNWRYARGVPADNAWRRGGGFVFWCFGAEPIQVTNPFRTFPLPELQSPCMGRTWQGVM